MTLSLFRLREDKKKGVFSVYFPSFSTVLDGGKIISLSILAVSGLNDPPLFLANDILSALFLPLMVFFSEKEISPLFPNNSRPLYRRPEREKESLLLLFGWECM